MTPPVLAHTLAVAFLLAARVLPFALLSPWLALRAGPAFLSFAVATALTLSLLPQALASAPAALTWTPQLWLSAWPELLRGLLFGFALALPLHVFAWAGRLYDALRDPQLLGSVSMAVDDDASGPLGQLCQFAAIALFFATGGHGLVLTAFVDTLRYAPLGSAPQAVQPVLLSAALLVSKAFSVAVLLSAPVLLCLLVATFALGLLARVAAPVVTHWAQGPLRPFLGVAVLCLCASRVLLQVPLVLQVFMSEAQRMLHVLG